jgi:hypothetical protein
LLAEYPDAAKALEAYQHLTEKYAPELTAENRLVELEDKTWFTAWIQGNTLGAIFNGSSREQTEKIYKTTINNL